MTTPRRGWSAARHAVVAVVVVAIALAGCRRRVPPSAPPPKPPAAREAWVSDVATGGDWQAGGRSGMYRVVVRGGSRQAVRSEVLLQWLAWDAGHEQPVEVASVRVTELSRGLVVTNSRIDQEEGRAVVKLGVANPVTGASGEARIWPDSPGKYRVKLKWRDDSQPP